jgi:uncharacterized GH25 family protein
MPINQRFFLGFALIVSWLGVSASRAQDALSDSDREAIETYNRESQLLVFGEPAASSLGELVARDYPDIEFPAGTSGKTIDGTVVDAKGRPVPNVVVLLITNGIRVFETENLAGMRDVLAKQITDAGGRFRFDVPKLPSARSSIFRVLAFHPKIGFGVENLISKELSPGAEIPPWEGIQLTLRPTKPLFGQVMYQGAPIAGAEVCIKKIFAVRQGISFSYLFTAKDTSVGASDMVTHTNGNGEFRFDAVPTTGRFEIRVRHPDHPATFLTIQFFEGKDPQSEEVKFTIPDAPKGYDSTRSLSDPLVIELEEGMLIRGRVHRDDLPCEGAIVLTSEGYRARTDKLGVFAMRIPSMQRSTDTAVTVYQNCVPFVAETSLIGSTTWNAKSAGDLDVPMKPATLVTGSVRFQSPSARLFGMVTLNNDALPIQSFPSFGYGDDYWVITCSGKGKMLLNNYSSGSLVTVAALTDTISGSLFRFAELKDQFTIRLPIELVDGSGVPMAGGQLSVMSLINFGTNRLAMSPLVVENGRENVWNVSVRDGEHTHLALSAAIPGDEDSPWGWSGSLMIVLDSSYRQRETPLRVQLNRNSPARLLVESTARDKPRVQFTVSQSVPPAPASFAQTYTTDVEGSMEIGLNPFSYATVQVIAIDGQAVAFYPITFDPNRSDQIVVRLGEESISGKLMNAEGNPVSKRWIYLWPETSNTNPLQWTQSNLDGSFRFSYLPQGEYRVQAVDMSAAAPGQYDANAVGQVSQNVPAGSKDIRLQFPAK